MKISKSKYEWLLGKINTLERENNVLKSALYKACEHLFEYDDKIYIELNNDIDYASLEFDCIELKAGILRETLKRMLKGKKALSIGKILESYEMN